MIMMNSRTPAGVYYDGILPGVEKPSRYIDRELNLSSAGFTGGGFNVLLVFPDVYEIGMTHQGLRLLYHVLSRRGIGVEYAFAPWPDMEKRLRLAGEPLRSWQTGTPIGRFDLIGFTIPYELHYTNVLAILDLAGLASEASARGDGAPVVIAGGPCTSNPLPVINAFDAVFLGDGEESLVEAVDLLAGLKASGACRTRMRAALAGIEGVYVDGLTESAKARTYLFREGDLPLRPIVPSASIVHERLSVELLRGCTRGCRFCQAGMTYRPRRERSVDEIVGAACEGLDASGWEDVSLLSLSTSDYSRFGQLLTMLEPRLQERKVSLSLPSLRPETICGQVVAASALVRKTGFTIAPEAGTMRLRRVINKGMSDDEILQGCSNILDAGWQTLKLYFMIGLPTETDEDLQGIVDLVRKIIALPRAGRRLTLNVSISPFVPRAHTPFQWHRQCSMAEIAGKEKYLSARLQHRCVQLSLRDPSVCAIEGVFARGTKALWPVLVAAFERGCRFDGWRDQFDFSLWNSILEERGMTLDGLLSGFSTEDDLPWERFGSRVSRNYLLSELGKAWSEELTPDCRISGCAGCGACRGEDDRKAGRAAEPDSGKIRAGIDGSDGVMVRADSNPPAPRALKDENPRLDGPAVSRYRFTYEKTGRMRFLSHREFINMLHRALRRSGLPLVFTEGFHPIPKLSMGPSLAVGVEGTSEFFDVDLAGPAEVGPRVFEGLLPDGIKITESGGPFGRKEGKLSEDALYRYEIDLSPLVFALGGSIDDAALTEETRGGEMERMDFRDHRIAKTDDKSCRSSVEWTRLGKGLESSGGPFSSPEDFLEDPAGWLSGRFNHIIGSGIPVSDRRGNKRGSEGCRVFPGENRYILGFSPPSGGRPGPKDLLFAVMPGAFAELARIRRTEIRYRSGDEYIQPMDLIKKGL